MFSRVMLISVHQIGRYSVFFKHFYIKKQALLYNFFTIVTVNITFFPRIMTVFSFMCRWCFNESVSLQNKNHVFNKKEEKNILVLHFRYNTYSGISATFTGPVTFSNGDRKSLRIVHPAELHFSIDLVRFFSKS